MTDRPEELSRAPIEILNNVANIIEQIMPEALVSLGGLALNGPMPSHQQQWVDDLNEASERIYYLMEDFFTGINGYPTVKQAQVEETALPAEEEAQTESQAEPAAAVLAEEEEPAVLEPEFDIAAHLGLSDNERRAAKLALEYLNGSQKRQNIKDITLASFGRPRLPKEEEERFIEILSGYAGFGLVERYGKSFGPALAEGQTQASAAGQTETVQEGAEALLDEFDLKVLEIVKAETSRSDRINIGQIVREHTNGQRLPREEYLQFLFKLNRLVDVGYLWHGTEEPAWYGLGEVRLPEPPKEVSKRILKAITTPALMPTAEPAAEAGEEQAVTSLPEAAGPYDKLIEEIVEFALKFGQFRMEDLRHSVASVMALSDEDYKDFKFQFGQLRQTITEYLKAQGKDSSWQESGQARGKKYLLTLGESVETAETAELPVVAGPVAAKAAPVQRQAKARQPRYRYQRPAEPQKPEYSAAEIEAFSRKLAGYIGSLLAGAPNGMERMTVIKRDIFKQLNVSEAEAHIAINNLVAMGLVYKGGTVKGSRIISMTPITKESASQQGSAGAEKADKKTEAEWNEMDDLALYVVLQSLADLPARHLQQGVDVNKLSQSSNDLKYAGVPTERIKRVARAAAAAGVMSIQAVNRTAGGGRSQRTSKMIAVVTAEQRTALKENIDSAIKTVKESL